MTRRLHARRAGESGMTLIEVLIGVVLLSLITGALSSAFVTAISASRPTGQRVQEANDAQVIASFLVADAQAAGGVNPLTSVPDPNLGVSLSDDGGCAVAAGALKIGFSWIDHTSATTSHRHVANYSFDAGANRLTRTKCIDGKAPRGLTLGESIASVDPRCDGSLTCPNLPKIVSLTITSTNEPKNAPTPYTYTLTASLRIESQTAPTGATEGTVVPLLALGGGSECAGSPGAGGLHVTAGAKFHVYGSTVLNTDGVDCAAAMIANGGENDYGAGATLIYNGGRCEPLPGCPTDIGSFDSPMPDPYEVLAPPAGTCSGSANEPTSGTFSPRVYNGRVTISGDANFEPGNYIFCDGLAITSGNVTGDGVLLYLKGGTLSVNGSPSIELSGPTSGRYRGVLVWQDNNTTPMVLQGDGTLHFNGAIYAPSAEVDINANAIVTRLIAQRFLVQGGIVGVGTKPPIDLAITDPATLPNWTDNKPYPTTTVKATGGSGVYAWSATDLPPGLTIDAVTGTISGTPTVNPATATGFNVVVKVRDTFGDTNEKPYPIVISPPPRISDDELTDWTKGRDYPGTAITANEGTTPYTWAATGLPAGLSMNATTGVVSGTPTTVGTSNVSVTVTDVTTATATKDYTIKINDLPVITGPADLPTPWTSGQPYESRTMTATSGTQPYSWSANDMPAGITINEFTGVIGGRPTQAGDLKIQVALTDKAGASVTKPYTVKINAPVGIATGSIPNGEQGRPFNFTLTPNGGGTPPLAWSATGLPSGLGIDAGTGTISGTPTTAGAYDVTVTIRDRVGATASKTYTFTINPPVTINGPAGLDSWTVGRDYPGTQVTAGGGIAPYRWSAPNLPPGLAIDSTTGVISGTPNAAGTSSVSVTVVDAVGGTATQTFSLTINALPQITTTTLPDAEQTVPYSATMRANLGTPQYRWVASGLPSGLTIDENSGVISGSPVVAGTFFVTITVADVAGATSSVQITFTVGIAPTVGGPTTLPNWTVNQPYPTITLTGNGGTAPFRFTATGLPPGLTLDANSGDISGTPTATGTFTPTVTITDARGATSTRNYTVQINPAPAITGPANLPDAGAGGPYPAAVRVTANGGTTPRFFSATGLPGGLSIGPGGLISGTPTTPGPYAVTVTVTDNAGATDTRNYTLTINPPPTITSITPAVGVTNTTAPETIVGTDFVNGATVTFSPASGSDPPNVTNTVVNLATLITVTIDIPNTANAPGTYDVTITNPDGGQATLPAGFTVT